MINQNTIKVESTFKNSSFPEINLDCVDNLIFQYSSGECQKILNLLIKETDKKEIEIYLKKAFNYDNTNFKLIEKIKETNNENLKNLIELYEPLFKYDFKSKIFDLIQIIQNYNKNEILSKIQINEIINNNYNELKDLVHQFNKEINNENEKLIYMIIYYNWISNLLDKINIYKEEMNFGYLPLDNLNEKVFSNKIINNENYSNSLDFLSQKISEIKEYLKLDNNIDNEELLKLIEKEIISEKIKEMVNYKNNNNNITNVTNEKIKKLTQFELDLNNYIKCLNSFEYFFSDFYESYLFHLSIFLNKIPKTLKYLSKLDIINVNILNDFIFFVSNYDFYEFDYNELIDYYETTFDEFIENKEYCQIENNNLIIYGKIIIENYNNYNLNYFNFSKSKKMIFKYEKYIKFNLISKESLFCKYKNIYLDFFKKLFLEEKSCIKKLFINTFPVLKDKYFINEDLLNYIFNQKIHIFNFIADGFAGQTNPCTFNIYIKSNFDNNKAQIETQICFYAAYIIIIVHEIAHFIRLYIFKYTGRKEYEKSFDIDDETKTDLGFFIEKNLFGKIINEINILEAFYILDVEYYYKEINLFLKDFSNSKKMDINQINNNVKTFLNVFDIKNINLNNINKNNNLLIKGNNGYFTIGNNNDRDHFHHYI